MRVRRSYEWHWFVKGLGPTYSSLQHHVALETLAVCSHRPCSGRSGTRPCALVSGHGSDKAVTSGLSSNVRMTVMSWPHSFRQVTPKVGTRGFGVLMGSEGAGMGTWPWSGSRGAGRRRTVRMRSLQVTQEASGLVWIKWRCWVVSTESPR